MVGVRTRIARMERIFLGFKGESVKSVRVNPMLNKYLARRDAETLRK
jgi:hypothetical protein